MAVARPALRRGTLRGGEAALGLGLALLLTAGVVGATLVGRAAGVLSPPFILALLLLQEAGHLAIAVGIAWRKGVPWGRMGFRLPRGGLGWAALAPLLILGFTALYAFAVQGLGYPSLRPPPIPPAIREGEGVYALLMGGTVALLAPLAEEVFFRGFLLTALAHSWPRIGALVFTSAVFALFHGSVALFIPVFFAGMVLGALYLRSGSLLVPLIAHALQNTLVYAVSRWGGGWGVSV
jgi:ABC-2 type transport system permease protein